SALRKETVRPQKNFVLGACRAGSGPPNPMALPSRDEDWRRDRRQSGELMSLRIEVRRIEPAPERGVERRPLAIDRRVPGRVAIAAFVDARLAEDAFVGEAKALRGGA